MSQDSHEPITPHSFSPWKWIAWTAAILVGLWVAITAVHRYRMEKVRTEVESRGGRLEGREVFPGWYEWLLEKCPNGWPAAALLKFNGNFQRVVVVHLPPGTTPPHDLIARLIEFREIKQLRLPASQLTDADLDGLSKLTSLQQLNLSGNAVTDRGLAQLANLPELAELELFETRAAGHFLEHSSRWPNLSSINLSHSPVTGEGLARMGSLPNLRFLLLDHSQVSDVGLTSLATQPDLRTLRLDDTLITDKGLAAVDNLRFPKLEVLNVSKTAVTAEGISRLQLSRLKQLYLPQVELSDEHWRELVRMMSLRFVRWGEIDLRREFGLDATGRHILLDSFVGVRIINGGRRVFGGPPRYEQLRFPKSPAPETPE